MEAEFKLSGVVVSGKQKAAFFTQLPWVLDQCRDKLGFTPYPGTLNLTLDEGSSSQLDMLTGRASLELIPPDADFCSAKVWPVLVGGINGALVFPADDVRVHDRTVVEILAPCRLKDALNLADGDTLTFSLAGPPSGGEGNGSGDS